jgi:peptidoglycan/xylan/chitin deacetylase (PgdA/CDA1 family)
MKQKIGLIFHGIGSPGRPLEQGEAVYWVSIAQFEKVLTRIAALPDPTEVQITFDDGNLSDFEIAMPRLQALGLTAQVFVLSGRLGQNGSLGPGHLRSMHAAGFAIGSHGIAHRNWARISATELQEELVRSKADLSEIVGVPVTSAAIPFGSYNARVLSALRRAGYQTAWTSDRGHFDPQAFLRPRTSIRSDTTDAEIAAVLKGQMPLGARLRRAAGMTRRRCLNL